MRIASEKEQSGLSELVGFGRVVSQRSDPTPVKAAGLTNDVFSGRASSFDAFSSTFRLALRFCNLLNVLRDQTAPPAGLTDKLVQKHQGVGYGGQGQQLAAGDYAWAGSTSSSQGAAPTRERICNELKRCEDVEIVWTYDDTNGIPTGGHVVRVFEWGITLGVPWLGYLQ